MVHIGVTFVNIVLLQFASSFCFLLIPPTEKVFGAFNERYFISLNRVPWSNARAICTAHLLDFIRFDNAEEFAKFVSFINKKAHSNSLTRLWIGGIFESDSWRWVSNDQPMKYTNWLNGESPDTNNCVRANKIGWSGSSCGKHHYFACEKRPEMEDKENEEDVDAN